MKTTKKIFLLLACFFASMQVKAQVTEYDKNKDSTLVEFLYFMDVCREVSLATDSIDPYRFDTTKIRVFVDCGVKNTFKVIIDDPPHYRVITSLEPIAEYSSPEYKDLRVSAILDHIVSNKEKKPRNYVFKKTK